MAKKFDSQSGTTPPFEDSQLRILVISAARTDRMKLVAQLESYSAAQCAATGAAGLELARANQFDAVIVDIELPDAEGSDVCQELLKLDPTHAVLMRATKPSLEDALTAMGAGAFDMLASDLNGADLLARIRGALHRSAVLRSRDSRRVAQIQRLQRLCRHLGVAREEISKHVGSLCSDLTHAYRELSDKMVNTRISSEFSAIVRQELDLEELLRTMLEYVLAKVGATNAAVLLPSSNGDFTLGAYVNYDCPKDAAELLFEQLATELAPRFEHSQVLTVMNSASELSACLGEQCEWLADSAVMIAPCRFTQPGQPEECLGLIVLFRDRRTPFVADSEPTMKIIADLFARQLSRVIQCHHRHLPKHKWGAPGSAFTTDPEPMDERDDDIDLAA